MKKRMSSKLLYPLEMPLRQRIELIAKEVYGADGVTYTAEAEAKAKRIEADPELAKLGTCKVKTHLSLSTIRTSGHAQGLNPAHQGHLDVQRCRIRGASGRSYFTHAGHRF